MFILLFALLLVAVLLTWYGKRRYAIGFYIITMIIAIMMFYQHMTSQLNIQL